jgi:carbon-monoxide dehydrogenase small subunit
MADITLKVNGTTCTGSPEARKTLADFLRDDLNLTGTHLGCEHGVCGACTVLVNDKPVRSCLMFGVQAEGKAVRTVEGLAENGTLHALQQAFHEHHGLQCGFCTPGMVMSAVDLVKNNPNPTEQQIRDGLEGNICRCTGYHNIVKAIAAAHPLMHAKAAE